jgi:hypothetical protein
MIRSVLAALAAALMVAACAGTPSTPATARGTAIPSGLPLGCVPNAQTQRCDEFGTYYSGDDLRRTGAQHVGQALRMVDPQLAH